MIALLYLLAIGLLATGLGLLLHHELKRAVARQRYEAHVRRIRESYVQLQIVLVDRLTPALREMAAAIEKAAPAFAKLGEALRKDVER